MTFSLLRTTEILVTFDLIRILIYPEGKTLTRLLFLFLIKGAIDVCSN